MIYEVEMKFRVPAGRAPEAGLAPLEISWAEPYEEVDRYYGHPARDFVRTDEALRIRYRNFPDDETERKITYKGPKIDTETKTRREIEIPLAPGDPWEDILDALGFTPRGIVRKIRRRGTCVFRGRQFEVLRDHLPELDARPGGGHFIELETLADERELAEARSVLLELAGQLDLGESVRTSYLGLLAEARGAAHAGEPVSG